MGQRGVRWCGGIGHICKARQLAKAVRWRAPYGPLRHAIGGGVNEDLQEEESSEGERTVIIIITSLFSHLRRSCRDGRGNNSLGIANGPAAGLNPAPLLGCRAEAGPVIG
ncbi:unnamed protein product [Boreogadus saida]